MKVAHLPAELPREPRAVAIGTFDGVHLGHRRVLESARAAGPTPTVITFDPHPRVALGNQVELLTTLERRLELFEEAGVADTLVVEFTPDTARLEPEEFVDGVLRPIGTEVVVAGENFRFGRARVGQPRPALDARLRRPPGSPRRARLVQPAPASAARRRDRACCSAARPAARGGGNRGRGRRAWRHARLSHREPGGRTLSSWCPPTESMQARWATTAPRSRSGRTRTTAARSGGSRRSCSTSKATCTGRRLVVELWKRLSDERVFESEQHLIDQIALDVEATARRNAAGLAVRKAVRVQRAVARAHVERSAEDGGIRGVGARPRPPERLAGPRRRGRRPSDPAPTYTTPPATAGEDALVAIAFDHSLFPVDARTA